MGRYNLFDNLWCEHTVKRIGEEEALLAVDRIFLHDLSGTFALQQLEQTRYTVKRPDSVFAMSDHTVASAAGRTADDSFAASGLIHPFERMCRKFGVRYFPLNTPQHGVVHIVGPEQGLSLPGMTVVCGDSHTCTHGAVGALAWGISVTDLYHSMTTQTIRVKKPKTMRIRIEGQRGEGIAAMDIALYLLSQLGTRFTIGYAVEFGGSVVRAMNMDDRFTICNVLAECGSEFGIISPDETTWDYVRSTPGAPKGVAFEQMKEHCRALSTTEESAFDCEVTVDITGISPQVSWGIYPNQSVGVDGVIPPDASEEALHYMDLSKGQAVKGLKIDKVFIGSCCNGRLSNLIEAAAVVRGQRVAPGVEASVVAGSQKIKEEAEALGLDQVFRDAGFRWGEAGCSLCGGSNGETTPPGKRSVCTTNRNFANRQGRGARIHLASPATAALAALTGRLC